MTMSDLLRIPVPERALRAWGAVPGQSGGFTLDPRFARQAPAPPADFAPMPDPEHEDPIERAHADGFAAGHAAALAEAQALAATQDAERHRIDTALRRMDESQVAVLESRLRQTVLALCDVVLADAAIDPVGLEARVRRAAQMLARAEDARVIRLHPEDLALVGNHLPEDWHCEPDSTLERGTVRVDGAMGGVEDGPAQWRRALDEALRQC
ncbi:MULTISPECIES: FliH/SctL family protein [unclassified Novosphingobium]|uniref:FliH/SctL family protein n=1 Tax=unclassified Novosphingobium TaxID=2644732 RepID=UPI00183AAF87|nr:MULTISPECIES: FliH/SctL family protein [unclassified Novosphingobium]NMN87011.1 flagellar assembly protein FliH [Novosphingobium sp. SG916]